MSVTPTGQAGNADSEAPVLSATGRFVAFQSSATNLAAGCTSGVRQVLRRDRTTGETACLSAGPGGGAGDRPSGLPAISADGSVVVFESSATNLASACGGGGATQVFVRAGSTTTCASVGPDGTTPGNAASRAPAVSADGSRVA